MQFKKYQDQVSEWPRKGNHILANYDDDHIMVYQAFNEDIGYDAIKCQSLEGDSFDKNRMSWIKPNFLWMMYRSDWGKKKNQEVVLGISIVRQFFDEVLTQAVPSSFESSCYEDRSKWRADLDNTNVIVQWDPSRNPSGRKIKRKAIQLGLRGEMLKRYISRETIKKVLDISSLAAEMQQLVAQREGNIIEMPIETIYPVTDSATRKRLGIS